ncbi:TorF family putative porin [Dyella solisilvae]|uniref:TorF family putative porin n=1 Tax=Dyella solisilvae TaxID=1920168 RepID=UPI001314716B|nr:TorF family putative porin [Dyella solisilvae]
MAVGIACVAVGAHAQVSGNATLLSDYRFRGVSLSDDKPAAQASINFDALSSGWYAGGMLSSARVEQKDVAQLLGYGGYAQRLGADFSWEAGLTYSRFTGHDAYPYAEAYGGLAWKRLVARLYYTPDYFNSGVPAWYLDLDGSQPLSTHWYLFGHVGWLRRNGELSTDHTTRYRTDLHAGLGFTLKPFDFQLGWSGVLGSHGSSYFFGYPVDESVSRDAWIASLSYAW